METRDAFRSVVENITGICQLKPEQEECLVHILNGGDVVALLLFKKFNLSTVTDRQRETGEACDWLTGTPMILNFRQAPPHEKVNTCQLCPSRLCLRSKAK